MALPPSSRVGLIGKIHVAKKQLGLDDDAYRDILRGATGKQSCSTMNEGELENTLSAFKKLGFKPDKGARRAGARRLADSPHAKKIRAMWLELHEKGAVRDPSEKALATYVMRMVKVSDLHWINSIQASVIINALRAWIDREEEKNT